VTVIVTLKHCRALRYCSSGLRSFCQRHGLDWRQLRESGLPAETIEATGDAMAIAAARHAREQARNSA
jgi:hypothetical protein